MRILFIRYNKKTIQNEDTFYQILFRKNFKIKLILKRVTHKINRINNVVIVNVISFFIFYFLFCVFYYLVVVSAP